MINELKLDELKDMFFYTFGIVPLQNYNVIGDGMTDNRLSIQQAIYDAIEVGAKYIFVPKGNYYYSHTLFKSNEVIFIGNNVDTYIKDIEIRQFPDLWNEAQASSSAGKKIPNSYLKCDGQNIKTSDYINLYATLNDVDINENALPENFEIPNISTGNDQTIYIIRAK